jgi:Glycosidases
MKRFVFFLVVFAAFTGVIFSQEQTVPEWAKKVVWYQIFPERFRNGNPKNDPKASDLEDGYSGWKISPWTSDWYKLQPWEKEHSRNFYDDVFDRRYGGDFEGIIEELPYLHRLGVNAIYLNPIFESPSLHKYNTATYIHVDHNFGPDPEGDLKIMAEENPADPSTWKWTSADSIFLRFIRDAHKLGMKVIIDGVFNHVGTDFWAFKDVVRNQQKSKYRNWFVINSWNDPSTGEKFDYAGWWGIKSLPVFRKDSVTGLVHGPREHIFAITKRWMEPDGNPHDGIDGWRLDVPNEIPHPFWKDWRKLVKGINPQAYIVGEIWGDASPWLKGDEFDGVMNYSLAKAMVHFFIDKKLGISPTEFESDLRTIRKSYPEDIDYVLQNLIDSHDTDRLASMIVNPDRPYDSGDSPRNNPNYSVRKPEPAEIKRQKLVVLFQMTYVGAPMIYYGDEAGMWGADDPDDRKPMLWADLKYEDEKSCPVTNCTRPDDKNVFNKNLFDYYSKLIHERLSNDALMLGTYKTLVADDSKRILVFERRYKESIAIVGFNLGINEGRVSIPVDFPVKNFKDVLTGRTFKVENNFLKFEIDPGWGILLVNNK